MDISKNLLKIKGGIADTVKLVAVSKTKPVEDIVEAYNAGQRIFGENKVQELIYKQPELPGDIQWHFIGHMQTNKVKFIAPFVSMIEAVDSLKLLREIDKQAAKNHRTINCMMQFHIAGEDTKFGLDLDEAGEILESPDFKELKNVNICGVMGMATFTDDMGQVRGEFRNLKKIFDELKSRYFSASDEFKEISMGMSGDYQIAIEEGSTMVRIGSLIFGERG
ncbi:MAG: YggS family pyridoxal phosphate enzyme [Bacteroidetes bacterium 4484_276]|nr:MAG: YggS family pyridoxal phosphate enzyme [Bacteroidetes bacterium 4484_276]